MSTVLVDLAAAELVLVSHIAAIRKELNGEVPYTSADKDERGELCKLLVEKVSSYIEDTEDLTPMQFAALSSILNNLIGLRRALSVSTVPQSNQPYAKLENSRDISSLSLKSYRELFLDEESSKLDTIPEYF